VRQYGRAVPFTVVRSISRRSVEAKSVRACVRAFENRAKAATHCLRLFELAAQGKKARVFITFALRPDGRSAVRTERFDQVLALRVFLPAITTAA
jgi:hypothetical protein